MFAASQTAPAAAGLGEGTVHEQEQHDHDVASIEDVATSLHPNISCIEHVSWP